MKRLISLCLFAVFLIGTLAVPVSASEFDSDASSFINVLDYVSANDSGSNNFSSNSSYVATANFDLAIGTYIRYVDIVFTSAGGDPTSITINGEAINLVKISTRLFRAYGTFVVTSGDMRLDITSNVTGVRYSIISFKASAYSSMSYPETGFLAVGTSYWASSYVYMNAPESPATVYIHTDSAHPIQSNYIAYVYPENWKLYDYMDVYISIHATALDSVTVNIDGKSIPFQMSYCDISTGDWVSYDTSSGQGIIVQNEIDTVYIMLELDLTQLDRTSTVLPQITITGQYLENNTNEYVSLLSVTGYVEMEVVSANSNLLTSILHALQNGFTELFDDLSNYNENIYSWFTDLRTKISTEFTNLKTALTSHFNNLKTWIQAQTDAIVNAILGDPMDGDELRDNADLIQDDVDDITKFEQDQQAVLDNNFQTIQDTVSVTGFGNALAFVQHYTEGIFLGMGDYFIVFSLPLFLGLFFFVCSRIPGVTRWRSRPSKDGDSG